MTNPKPKHVFYVVLFHYFVLSVSIKPFEARYSVFTLRCDHEPYVMAYSSTNNEEDDEESIIMMTELVDLPSRRAGAARQNNAEEEESSSPGRLGKTGASASSGHDATSNETCETSAKQNDPLSSSSCLSPSRPYYPYEEDDENDNNDNDNDEEQTPFVARRRSHDDDDTPTSSRWRRSQEEDDSSAFSDTLALEKIRYSMESFYGM